MGKLRVGINGFGRIGRILFRAGFDKIEVVGINNLGNPKLAAHLLKYDSTHGRFPGTVENSEKALVVNGRSIPMSASKDPLEIPWKDWGVDLVLECTGALKGKEDSLRHIKAGAKKVLVSAPAPGADLTVVYGINHEKYNPAQHTVISNASCTTNCLAPLVKVIHDNFTVQKGMMTTIHSYTNDQRVLDSDHSDLRRARSAAMSMIPTTTGAAKAVGEVLPELKGKIDGTSIRVPTPNVSLVDFVAVTEKELSVETVNGALSRAANSSLKGVMYCEKDPLVSVDFIGNPHSSIVDMAATMVMAPNMCKVFSWYDNEMGFSHRMIDFALYMEQKGMA